MNSAKKHFFGVDGLFRTMDEELAVCSKSETPFGQPKGTKVVMRFQPDDKLGIPTGTTATCWASASIAIDVNALSARPRGLELMARAGRAGVRLNGGEPPQGVAHRPHVGERDEDLYHIRHHPKYFLARSCCFPRMLWQHRKKI